ncbi:MAG: dTDP-4-dehydrorhamnose 3,5-epimerase [Desulfobacterales bacterium]|nr:dTDP-4-dehydrorhamnose 3,5-epimerase [Desulfobacterales bacterium]
MEYFPLSIPGMVMMKMETFGDDRGFFMETFRDNEFRGRVADVSFVQENYSRSLQGVLRGLHYQIQNAQGKLIRVLQGRVFDVGVDLRRSSPHFGKWCGTILSSENKEMLWVPPGFAHGFYVMSETAELEYKCTDYYAPEFERSLAWDDPELGIDWPLVSGVAPQLSDKDRNALPMNQVEVYP